MSENRFGNVLELIPETYRSRLLSNESPLAMNRTQAVTMNLVGREYLVVAIGRLNPREVTINKGNRPRTYLG
jgi:hypothetical protein